MVALKIIFYEGCMQHQCFPFAAILIVKYWALQKLWRFKIFKVWSEKCIAWEIYFIKLSNVLRDLLSCVDFSLHEAGHLWSLSTGSFYFVEPCRTKKLFFLLRCENKQRFHFLILFFYWIWMNLLEWEDKVVQQFTCLDDKTPQCRLDQVTSHPKRRLVPEFRYRAGCIPLSNIH